MIYSELSETFPVPKVELEAGVPFGQVWKRLTMPVHLSEARDAIYLLVHNKLPVRERMFRIGLAGDPYCTQCVIWSTSSVRVCEWLMCGVGLEGV